ncbi:MFS transporter [Zestomonas insulae]|uniref:MFS transporter n=1 Tax=Zestomonas insulae TaxID=2809017 RepID=UPI001EF6AD77|nr:MFS transporter [Pseudomonas insulae]
MLLHNSAIRLLFAGQALYWSCAIINITLAALVGIQLAPATALTTLPLALMVLGSLFSVQPLSSFMQRHGRRPGLMLGASAGVLAGLLCALGITVASFSLFCLGCLALGAYQASMMYYRFAAQEAVSDAHKGRATAYVVAGGVLAALLAPSLLLWSRDAVGLPFVGAYLALAALAALGLALMACLREGAAPVPGSAGLAVIRQLLGRPAVRAAIATTAVGHGLMILVMNATPLAMRFCGFPVEVSAQVIQWHSLGMFLPAFVAGPLVDRFGSRRIAVLGAVTLLVSAGIAISGVSHAQFLLSSFLLGLGWNLMLVAGTTLLGEGHSASERGQAQGLMELGNGSVAALASLASGALVNGIGWGAVNLAILPLVAIALLMLLPARRAVLAQP